MAKRFTTRGLSKHRSYTLDEAALIINASVYTLRSWAKAGKIEVMSSKRPYLVSGESLITHVKGGTNKARKPLVDGKFHCMSCREHTYPYGRMADYEEATPTRGRLIALCETCESGVSLFVGIEKLDRYAEILEIAYR